MVVKLKRMKISLYMTQEGLVYFTDDQGQTVPVFLRQGNKWKVVTELPNLNSTEWVNELDEAYKSLTGNK